MATSSEQTNTNKGANSKQTDELFATGKLLAELGDFTASVEKLEAAALGYSTQSNHKLYIKCLTLCLRMYVEMEMEDEINGVKDRLHLYATKQGIELNSATYYTFGLIASYKGDNEKALEQLERALALALSDDSKDDMCFAIHGLAIVYAAMGRVDDSLKEIYNLRVFFQVLDLPELEISSQILNGYLLVTLKRYDEAIEIFWKTFDLLKEQKNIYTYVPVEIHKSVLLVQNFCTHSGPMNSTELTTPSDNAVKPLTDKSI